MRLHYELTELKKSPTHLAIISTMTMGNPNVISPVHSMRITVREMVILTVPPSWQAAPIRAYLPMLLPWAVLPANWKSTHSFNKPLRAKFFQGNIYLHSMSLLHNDMAQVVEILPRVRQEVTYPTYQISWLLMSWRHKEPGHQQQCYWPCWTGIIWSPYVKG